jgi:hypothetical protein
MRLADFLLDFVDFPDDFVTGIQRREYPRLIGASPTGVGSRREP